MRAIPWIGLALALACGHAEAADASRKPNILLIVADDLGYGALGCQGNPQIATPHIDSIAKHGVRFTSGYATSSVCSPSRAGLLTGRYSQRFGIELNPGFSHTIGLPPTEKTMAEYLKANGYATGMFGKWHLGFRPAMQPTARGFDTFFGFLGGAHSYVEAEGDRDPANVVLRGREKVASIDYLTDAFAREAVAFIESNHRQPWFVYLPFNAPHGPFQAPEKYTSRFPKIEDPGRRTFLAMLAAMDDAVGAVLVKVRELHLEQNTLIFFISDNGAPNHAQSRGSNHPLRGFKAQLTEGGIRVPFLVQWKGRVPAGKVDDRPVIALDVLPTVLAATGMAAPIKTKLDGVNLLPYLTGDKTGFPHDALFWRYGGQRAVRMGDWKLLRLSKQTQLYNLATDIGETSDLAAQEPAKLAELKDAYAKWNSSLRTRKVDPHPATNGAEENETPDAEASR